jgi:hypothetical protein
MSKKQKQAGRPSYRTTRERRELVAVLVAAGFTENQISIALGCAPKTLRKHFAAELDEGAIRINARVTKAIFDAAERGNTAAARFWRREIQGVLPPIKARRRPPGKKAIAAAESETASQATGWAALVDLSLGNAN